MARLRSIASKIKNVGVGVAKLPHTIIRNQIKNAIETARALPKQAAQMAIQSTLGPIPSMIGSLVSEGIKEKPEVADKFTPSTKQTVPIGDEPEDILRKIFEVNTEQTGKLDRANMLGEKTLANSAKQIEAFQNMAGVLSKQAEMIREQAARVKANASDNPLTGKRAGQGLLSGASLTLNGKNGAVGKTGPAQIGGILGYINQNLPELFVGGLLASGIFPSLLRGVVNAASRGLFGATLITGASLPLLARWVRVILPRLGLAGLVIGMADIAYNLIQWIIGEAQDADDKIRKKRLREAEQALKESEKDKNLSPEQKQAIVVGKQELNRIEETGGNLTQEQKQKRDEFNKRLIESRDALKSNTRIADRLKQGNNLNDKNYLTLLVKDISDVRGISIQDAKEVVKRSLLNLGNSISDAQYEKTIGIIDKLGKVDDKVGVNVPTQPTLRQPSYLATASKALGGFSGTGVSSAKKQNMSVDMNRIQEYINATGNPPNNLPPPVIINAPNINNNQQTPATTRSGGGNGTGSGMITGTPSSPWQSEVSGSQ